MCFKDLCRSTVTSVRVKGHIGQGEKRILKDRLAHNNVKLLHFYLRLHVTGDIMGSKISIVFYPFVADQILTDNRKH